MAGTLVSRPADRTRFTLLALLAAGVGAGAGALLVMAGLGMVGNEIYFAPFVGAAAFGTAVGLAYRSRSALLTRLVLAAGLTLLTAVNFLFFLLAPFTAIAFARFSGHE